MVSALTFVYSSPAFLSITVMETPTLEIQSEARRNLSPSVPDARIHPRYGQQVDIGVYSRRVGLPKGHTVDISESGVSAILNFWRSRWETSFSLSLSCQLERSPLGLSCATKVRFDMDSSSTSRIQAVRFTLPLRGSAWPRTAILLCH